MQLGIEGHIYVHFFIFKCVQTANLTTSTWLTHMAMSIGSKTVSASWQKAYKDIKLKKYADRYNMIGIEGPHLMK